MTRRLLLLVFVLVGVSLLTFTLGNLVPTDPARAALGFDATPDMVRQYRREMGLDKSAVVRYAVYLKNVLRGDLGVSIMTRRPVLDDLKNVVPATVELTLVSLVISVVVGACLGIIGATRRGSTADLLSTVVPLTQLSAPVFVFGLLLLLIFYRHLGWLPYGGRIGPGLTAPAPITGLYLVDSLLRGDLAAFRSSAIHLVLPAATLCNLTLAEMTRFTRSAFLQVLGEDYVRTARSKGVAERGVIWRHALRNAAIPVVTVVGLRLGFLLGGAVVTETIYAWPGLGRYAWEGARNADLNVVMGVTLVVALLYSIVNLGVDVTCAYLDPRVRLR
ncbi:MAG TPA: ABC transporter permease [Candidatus Methylomirabilis sp.]|nr:ABC transporter permease [Candidatus Methylomirabilis sp.]